ncbi:hypothetical protein Vadar_008607 [Vaccinium darrowii]|uniref:Uncharacterized protein n=1 Tax=Vaccinium darrowii TaxID=229202 RepID=A0ACB7ZAU8_9ERIC|nr:hypothetical protein Vadar_008607 [Vaccinium darrowii]
MSSSESQTNSIISHEKEEAAAFRSVSASTLPRILRVAVELDLFEIISKNSHSNTPDDDHGYLSASEIASHLPIKSPGKAPATLERLLRCLASFDFLKCKQSAAGGEGGGKRWLYGLAPLASKYFVCDQNGGSLAPMLLFVEDKVFAEAWYHMKDAILDGGLPFNKAHGMSVFEYPKKEPRFGEVFNKAMHSYTILAMKDILDKYKGFAGLKQIVDVGGGLGATLGSIVSKYPHIEGINYDLPQVVKTAPTWPGVQHVGGDMFESVPKGEVIFMKWILHDWSDEMCLKLLKNCWKALPESGKVIIVESILPENPQDNDPISRNGFHYDMIMWALTVEGQERTEKEFDALAKAAGFAASKPICRAANIWVIEFYKTI